MEEIWARADGAATPAEAIRDEVDAVLARHLERGMSAESLETELRQLRDRLERQGVRRRAAAREPFGTVMRDQLRWGADQVAWILLLGPPLIAAAILVAGALGKAEVPSPASLLLSMVVVWALIAPLGLKLRKRARWNPRDARADAAAANDFQLFAGTFRPGERMPREHAADGGNASPPLFWSTPPDGTVELVLVMYRRDRGDESSPYRHTHWLAWGIDPSARWLAGGAAAPVEGRNDFGDIGYRGPTGADGSQYHFVLYAVDSPLGLPAGASRAAVEEALFGRVRGVAGTLGS
jgi:phosphatidylethanolamine-binding protein (PEBP) family uncharacterized protein